MVAMIISNHENHNNLRSVFIQTNFLTKERLLGIKDSIQLATQTLYGYCHKYRIMTIMLI